MDNLLSVKEVAKRLQKSEETVKRWLRTGKFPNAFKETDKKGWQVPQQDISTFINQNKKTFSNELIKEQKYSESPQQDETIELVSLAYQAVTMTSPSQSIINKLNHLGIRRTLEILLILRQSPQKVKNPEGFIRKAISQGWSPSTLPIKKERYVARTQSNNSESLQRIMPFFNWLEED